MSIEIDPRLVSVAIAELPAAIAFFRAAFTRRHPDAPAPTSEDIIAAYESAFTSSLARDAAWLAAHPDV